MKIANGGITKLLFVDIDGVLNSIDLSIAHRSLERAPRHRLHDIDIVRVGILKWIVDMTGAEIVISSTWRIGRNVEWFVGFFEALNWPMPPIVGCTPTGSGFRGQEINDWLKEHSFDLGNCKYLILDDDSDFYDDQPFLHVDRIVGLSLKHACKSVRFLGLKNEEDLRTLEDLERHVNFVRDPNLNGDI